MLTTFPHLLIISTTFALSVSACTKRGGGVPCPEETSTTLRTEDGRPVGKLHLTSDSETLRLTFHTEDGQPTSAAFLLESPEGRFRYRPEISDAAVEVPWSEITFDPCGQSFAVALETLPTEVLAFTIACRQQSAPRPPGGAPGGQGCTRH